MKKKIVMVMLATVLALGLVACGTEIEERVTHSRDDEEDEDDEDEDDEDDEDEDEKDEVDEDEDDGDDEKDNEKSDGQGKNDKDNIEYTDEWYVDDDDIFVLDDPDRYDEYTNSKYYDKENGEITLCDYDAGEIMTLKVPEGFVVSFASESGACYDLTNASKTYDVLSVDYSDSLYTTAYITEGTIPDDDDIKDFKVTYDEYKKDGVEFLIARETYYSVSCDYTYTYNYILIPYELDGKKDYVIITDVCKRSEKDMEELAYELLDIE